MVPQSGIMFRMISKEVYLPQERKGVVEGYKGINKLTRDGALFLTPFAVAFAPAAVPVLLASAAFDHGQIKIIEWWQKRKERKMQEDAGREVLKQSGTIVEFPQNRGQTALPQAA